MSTTTLSLRFPTSIRSDEEVKVSPEKEVIIGRTVECDINLLEYYKKYPHKVSRTHCQISWQNERFVIVNHSRNGTWVNETHFSRGQAKALGNGDVIKIANDPDLVAKVQIKWEGTEPIDFDPQLERTLEALQKERDVMLLGVAGMGKTTLLSQLIDLEDTPHIFDRFWPDHISFVPCYVNGLAIGEMTLGGFFRSLIATTKPAFGQWPDEIREEYESLASGNCSIDQIISAMRATIKTVNDKLHKRILFLFDQFDDYYPKVQSELFSILKDLKQFQPKVIYVMAMRNEFDQSKSHIHQFLRVIDPPNYYWLPAMSDDELETVIARYHLSSEQRTKCIELGGRQPRLTLLVASYLQHMASVPSPTSLLVEDLLANNMVNDHCREIWMSLSKEEKKALLSVTKGKPNMSYTVEQRLTKKKMLLVGETDNLRIQNPLFKAYILSRGTPPPPPPVTPEGPTVKSASGEEIKIDGKPIPLKDLRPNEEKLLIYMYSKAGRVCSRGEIWDKVWGYKDKEHGSITKLISELRKKLDKISEGAGKRYIENVHGRGYSYVK